jgi:hypothetical protein
MKAFGKKKSNYMQGLKIAIMAIFVEWTGMACYLVPTQESKK